MKRIIPAKLPLTPDVDPVSDFPEDVERLITTATKAGYTLSSNDAIELWRRHCGDLCASWFEVAGDDQDILAALLKYAEVLPDAGDLPTPPKGYSNWLDFAVDSMEMRNEELERLIAGESVSRHSMRDAAHAELKAIRRKAGKS